MKTSLQWLRSLVPPLRASDADIVDALTRGGFHVQAVIRLNGDLEPVHPQEGEVPTDVPLEASTPAAFDTILDIADTERADVLGHVGMARELAALFRLPFQPPAVDAPVRVADGEVQSFIDVDVHEPKRCPHYGLLVVDDITVRPSPLWLRVRLHALGIDPQNNVVDLVHLATLESGHPVGAFDLARLEGPLVVRLAHEGERFDNLALSAEDLVVADTSGPVALAGVAPASRVVVQTSTRRAAIVCGCFEPEGILRTAQRHGMDTEWSRRHRRGTDRNDTAEVLAQTGALATRLAMGAAVPGTIHVFEAPWQARQVVLSRQTLPESIDPLRAKDVLEHLGFDVVLLHGEGLQVSIPSFRPDVEGEADVARELDRVHNAWSAAAIG